MGGFVGDVRGVGDTERSGFRLGSCFWRRCRMVFSQLDVLLRIRPRPVGKFSGERPNFFGPSLNALF